MSPLVLLVTSRHVDKHWLQTSESHLVMSEHVGGARRAVPRPKAHQAGFGATPQPTRLALSAPSVRRKRYESAMSIVMSSSPKR
ncbi:MAG: hypothetical protein E6I90_01755 [Chloroflexi bacterium]|nr:MAG: hypothetical protein E6I90_01755 [Chloroflexota bacterium]